MSYSDYDSDGYSSNEDADYVPSDGNLSEDDLNECEKEEPLHEDDGVPHPGDGRKRKDLAVRKRKKGVLKLDQEEEEEEGGEEEEGETERSEVRKEDDARQKKKSDDLWASFLSDVGSRPKDPPPTSQSRTTPKDESSAGTADPKPPGPGKSSGPGQSSGPATPSGPGKPSGPATPSGPGKPSGPATPSGPAKVTITKVFDFAGEEVRVNKVVSADSKEAKSYLKSQKQEEEEEDEASSPDRPSVPGPSAKRPAGMSGLLGRFGLKKQKMSTLEKSKMDWDAFKSEEGITEELAIHNRGREGYVERKNFLERVDHRQFELEKAVRQSNAKQ